MNAVIVYVHGLWLNGWEGAWLRHRLAEDLQAETLAFSYSAVVDNAAANATALLELLNTTHADTLHLVGHSLGGLLILKLFETDIAASLPAGRIVLLGSPVRGSQAARNLAQLPFGEKMLGQSVADLLEPRERQWNQSRELGIIAGDSGIGLGVLVGTRGAPSDGTIFVEETKMEGAADHLVLKVSHSGMLFSADVARAAGAFLRTGKFLR